MTSAAQLAANQANSHLHRPQNRNRQSQLRPKRHQTRLPLHRRPPLRPAEYEALLEEITDHFSTRDLTEQRCVREMADAEWRLRRARRFQEHMLNKKIHELFEATPEADLIDLQIQAHQLLATDPGLPAIPQIRKQFQRQYNAAYRTWTRYQAESRTAEKQDMELALQVSLNAPFLEYGERKSPNEPNPPHVAAGRNFQPAPRDRRAPHSPVSRN